MRDSGQRGIEGEHGNSRELVAARMTFYNDNDVLRGLCKLVKLRLGRHKSQTSPEILKKESQKWPVQSDHPSSVAQDPIFWSPKQAMNRRHAEVCWGELIVRSWLTTSSISPFPATFLVKIVSHIRNTKAIEKVDALISMAFWQTWRLPTSVVSGAESWRFLWYSRLRRWLATNMCVPKSAMSTSHW